MDKNKAMTPRTERERIEWVVQLIYMKQGLAQEEFPDEYEDFIWLIRRELAKERGRVRRIVKQQTRWKLDPPGCMTISETGPYIDIYRLLAARRGRKGKR